jgi:hypothetical protein
MFGYVGEAWRRLLVDSASVERLVHYRGLRFRTSEPRPLSGTTPMGRVALEISQLRLMKNIRTC